MDFQIGESALDPEWTRRVSAEKIGRARVAWAER
jgi:hypothetical protein